MTTNDIANMDFENLDKAKVEEIKESLETIMKYHVCDLRDIFESLDNKDKYTIYMEYAEKNSLETFIEMMYFDEYMSNLTPTKILETVYIRQFSPYDEGFWYNENGLVVSGSLEEFLNEKCYTDDICDWIEKNGVSCNVEGVQEWKEKYEGIIDLLAMADDRLFELD